MEIQKACTHILSQLADLVRNLPEPDLTKPSDNLSGSTVGQHLRHTLEFFICLEKGYDQGVVNYDKRAHDRSIERSKTVALGVIESMIAFVREAEERNLTLEVAYDMTRQDFTTVSTTVSRELIYNIEHAVHHMAIMKIGLREIAPQVVLPPDFGVAASTIRYQAHAVPASH